MEAREALGAIAAGRTLTRDEAESVMATVMAGEATAAQLGALLAALAVRGETVDEIAGFAAGMRAAAVPVVVPAGAIDTCGTGGDRSQSFNISTIAAIVAAAAGARVAKHGNRAASSACGSADVLEALGVKIELGPEAVATCVSDVGVGFMFAPRFHPAMRHAGPVRREIGIRTIFNVLGPLANPAGVKRQLLGVPSPTIGERMVAVLRELGAERALVVHSADGLDEISPSGPTRTWELRDGAIREGELTPEAAGLERAPKDSVRGGDPAMNAAIARRVLAGGSTDGPRTAVLLNAGAACYIAGLAADVRGGVALAAAAIDGGAAAATLARWISCTEALS
jgi:anthranilate phosphoribosyltransferase